MATDMVVEEIPLDKVVKNAWNPNVLPDKAFDRLVKEIEEVGYLDPVQVVPLDDGTYRLLGGEHRVAAVRSLGWESIPAVVLTGEKWKDEDLQKAVTVRLNVIRGKLDPTRMALLYDEMAEKYGKEALQDLFAYTDDNAWTDVLDTIKRGLKKSGLSADAQKEFAEAAKETKSVEDLGLILNQLFAQYGDTVNQSFMIFTYGKREHVYYAMTKEVRAAVKKFTKFCTASGDDLNDVLGPVIIAAAKKLPKPQKEAKPKTPARQEDVEF